MSTPHVHGSPAAPRIQGSFSGADERDEERHPAERRIRVFRRNEAVQGWLVDVSPRGGRIVLPYPVECQDELVIQIEEGGEPLAIPYVVRYWLKLWEGAFQIGVEVVDPTHHAGLLLKRVQGARGPSKLFQRTDE